MAYQITKKMVFRGGYGISYQPPTQNGWGPEALMGYNQGYTRFRASGEVAAVNPLLYLSNFAGAAVEGRGIGGKTGTDGMFAAITL